MSCTSLKRKLEPEDEDESEGLPKRTPVLEEPSSTYSLQRQAVLQLSLQKLCCVPPHTDTALARRVLITNTLRYIQEELSQQGALVLTPLTPTAGVPVEGSWEPPRGRGVETLPRPEGSLTPAWVLEQDGELFFSLHSSLPAYLPPSVTRGAPPLPPPSPTPKDSFSSALADIEDLFPAAMNSTSLASSFPSSSLPSPSLHSSEKDGKISVPATEVSEKDRTGSDEPMLDSSDRSASFLVTSSTPSSSSTFLPELSLDDFLFSDIDNFLCEYSPCGSNASAPSGPSQKVISMVTDDLMRSLTVNGGGGGGSAPLQSNQPFKMELNDLDHIMEVLVGS